MKRSIVLCIDRVKSFFGNRKYTKSYSQCGEDVIVSYALSKFGIECPYYVDIGAHDPYLFSNTAFFYAKGASGVCIEPDVFLFNKIKKVRKRDVCLQIGVDGQSSPGQEKKLVPFYVMSAPTLNTFSHAEAQRIHETTNYKIVSVVDVEIQPINALLEAFAKQRPNFVSLDVEGLDEDVLRSFDFKKYGPEVFCVETLEFCQGCEPKKLVHINDLMHQNGYEVYADTYINTVYIKSKI